MAEYEYTYIIVGGGIAGASAIEGIRAVDHHRTMLLVGDEEQLPYRRPALSKGLWSTGTDLSGIFVHDREFYDRNAVRLELSTRVITLDAGKKSIVDGRGNLYRFEKLLLATGGVPRRLGIPGGETGGIVYYRYLNDYLRLKESVKEGRTAVVVGGGFIGAELSAELAQHGVGVTMLFPEEFVCERLFPKSLARILQDDYARHGVTVLSRDTPASFRREEGKFVTATRGGRKVVSDIVIVGIGILPSDQLAQGAGLAAGRGIIVDEYLRTSHPDIFAAGDNAVFPYRALGGVTRLEHWDNATAQGRLAGGNMAGAYEPYDHIPYFFSKMFDFSYQGVGDMNAKLTTVTDWEKENSKGFIYYIENGRLKGIALCNVWGKIDAARDLLRKGKVPEKRRPALR